uniref:SAP domain-containing protein n=1 Tax=Latimeria chalumnae TaxID=7897 RepID=H3B6Z3_LATCH
KMAEMEDVTLDGKPLHSLRVTDLKAALEQRGLPKSGQKSALIKRLKGALMLENLQKHSTPHSGFQPNSQIGEEMSQNSFIKQYLEKQQELLRQRLEREAREAAEIEVNLSMFSEDKEDSQEEKSGGYDSSSCPADQDESSLPTPVEQDEEDEEEKPIRVKRLRGRRSFNQDVEIEKTPAGKGSSKDQEEDAEPAEAERSSGLEKKTIDKSTPKTAEKSTKPDAKVMEKPSAVKEEAEKLSRPDTKAIEKSLSPKAEVEKSPRPDSKVTEKPSTQKEEVQKSPKPDSKETEKPSTQKEDIEKSPRPDSKAIEKLSTQKEDGTKEKLLSLEAKERSPSSHPETKEKLPETKEKLPSSEAEEKVPSSEIKEESPSSKPDIKEKVSSFEIKDKSPSLKSETKEKSPSSQPGTKRSESMKPVSMKPPFPPAEEKGEKSRLPLHNPNTEGKEKIPVPSKEGPVEKTKLSQEAKEKENKEAWVPLSQKPKTEEHSHSRSPVSAERREVSQSPRRGYRSSRSSSSSSRSSRGKRSSSSSSTSCSSSSSSSRSSSRSSRSRSRSRSRGRSRSASSGRRFKSPSPASQKDSVFREKRRISQTKEPEKTQEKQQWGASGDLRCTEAESQGRKRKELSPESTRARGSTSPKRKRHSSQSEEERPPKALEPSQNQKRVSATLEIERSHHKIFEGKDVAMETESRPESEPADPSPDPIEDRSGENARSEDEKKESSVPKAFKRKIAVVSASKPAPVAIADSDGGQPTRKRRWGSSTVAAQKKPSISITTESLKSLIPEIKPVAGQEAVVDLHADDARISEDESERNGDDGSHDKGLQIRRTVTQVVPAEGQENGQEEEKEEEEEEPEQKEPQEVCMETSEPPSGEHEVKKVTLGDTLVRRSISQQKSGVSITIDDPVRTAQQPSPPRGKVTTIVHICNLVRPFTLGQLKELLNRTGTLIEETFWIDKIKSHCFATYSSVEEAVATRNALHGVKWPQSNPKLLTVDFAEQEQLDFHRGLLPEKPSEQKPPEEVLHPDHREQERAVQDQWAERELEMQRRERTRSEREWDRGKVREYKHEEGRRSRSRSRDRRRKERAKSKEKKSEKKEKAQEEPPAKLLDDLFRKTKAAPCIYWLPLTDEQIVQKVAERAERAKEREKRRKEQEEEERKREEERKERVKEREKEREKETERNREREREQRRDHSRGRDRERDRSRERRDAKRHTRSRSRSTPVRERGGRR